VRTWMVFSWSLIMGAVAALFYAISLRVRLRRLPAVVGTLGCALLSLLLLQLYREFSIPRHAEIQITGLPDGMELSGDYLELHGTVRPANARVAVLVHAQSDPRWWVQQVVRPNQTAGDVGQWTIGAYFGTSKAGRNETFYVVCLASANDVLSDLLTGRYLRQGQKYASLPPWDESPIKIVRRTE
jgi:hypothetical protein